MTRIIDSVANYLFPEVETTKEICASDWCHVLALPIFGLSVLLFVALHIS